MTLLRRFERPELYRGGYVSIGNFDGVHRGHQEIAQHLAARSRGEGVPAVVLTFDPHPLALLRPGHVPPSLTTLKQKAELLEQAGVTCVIAYPTDKNLLQLTPAEFVDSILVGQLAAKGIVEGPNFCFGKDRKGDIETLRQLCRDRKILLEVAEPVGGARAMVSSSTIRSLVASGQIAEAVKLLGTPYRMEGAVVAGEHAGATNRVPHGKHHWDRNAASGGRRLRGPRHRRGTRICGGNQHRAESDVRRERPQGGSASARFFRRPVWPDASG